MVRQQGGYFGVAVGDNGLLLAVRGGLPAGHLSCLLLLRRRDLHPWVLHRGRPRRGVLHHGIVGRLLPADPRRKVLNHCGGGPGGLRGGGARRRVLGGADRRPDGLHGGQGALRRADRALGRGVSPGGSQSQQAEARRQQKAKCKLVHCVGPFLCIADCRVFWVYFWQADTSHWKIGAPSAVSGRRKEPVIRSGWN